MKVRKNHSTGSGKLQKETSDDPKINLLKQCQQTQKAAKGSMNQPPYSNDTSLEN